MKKIGQLRQWLNEERITDPDKMVTNEELEYWLDEEKRKQEVTRLLENRFQNITGDVKYRAENGTVGIGGGLDLQPYLVDFIMELLSGEVEEFDDGFYVTIETKVPERDW